MLTISLRNGENTYVAISNRSHYKRLKSMSLFPRDTFPSRRRPYQLHIFRIKSTPSLPLSTAAETAWTSPSSRDNLHMPPLAQSSLLPLRNPTTLLPSRTTTAIRSFAKCRLVVFRVSFSAYQTSAVRKDFHLTHPSIQY